MPPQVDYAKLAAQHGGKPVPVDDLDALAAELGGAVEAAPAQAPPAMMAETPERGWSDTAVDVATGAAKGISNTVLGGIQAINKYVPGVRQASDAVQRVAFGDVVPAQALMEGARRELRPTNTPQKVGYYGEQTAEFFAPTGVVGKLGKAAEVAKAGALSLAQSGGDPASAGVSAALTAAIPAAGGLKTVAAAKLKEGAAKEMAQALGATKEWAKAEAAKLAPQMLKRGVGGSREAMLSTAKATAARVGSQLDDAYKLAAQAGETVPADIVTGNVQLVRDALQIQNAAGKRVTIPGTEGVVAKLDELAEFVQTLGPDIPVDKAAHVKRTWDAIVSKAGLFGPKATANATDSANAWAIREASNSFRELLNSNPSIAALNKEAAFWTGLKNVLKETQKRTQAQAGTGLVQAGTGGAGAVIGAMSGDSNSERAMNAVIGGLAGRQLVKLVQSPAFRTQVSGPLKQQLADALGSQSTGRIAGAVQRIIASMPAQMRPEFAQ